jgi:hypothetical protein
MDAGPGEARLTRDAPIVRVTQDPNVGAVSSVAIAVPIPVLDEGTRVAGQFLLTRGTVLGQRNLALGQGNLTQGQRNVGPGAARGGSFKARLAGSECCSFKACCGQAGCGQFLTMRFFQFLRHSSQSVRVTFSIDLAALCSQRPRRAAKSRFILAIAFGLPKCILAVSHPMS